MFTFLLVVQALIAASLVGVILMQQSEGGGLGMGGSPTGLMSARGAANFLTKATAYLAVTFVGLSIALAVLATQKTAPTTIDTSLARKPLPAAPAPVVPLSGDPAAAPAPTTTAPAPEPGPGPESAVPLAASPKPEAAAPKPVVSKPVVAAPKPIATKPVVAAPPPVTSTVPAPATPAPSPVGPPAENK
jgi:preprotein translocase subunit SecG